MFPLQNYGRSIISLPHYNVQEDAISDPTYGESADVQGRAKAQALLLQRFWNRSTSLPAVVQGLSKVVRVQPNTFFKADLVNPIGLSQKLPNHGTHFGKKRNSSPLLS